jgi:hypothetical protein
MKKIIILSITLLTIPLLASLNCINNSEGLQFGSFDTKTWRAVDCNCPCSDVRNGKCVECEHLQDARPLIIIKKSANQTIHKNKLLGTQTVKDTIKNLVHNYLSAQ